MEEELIHPVIDQSLYPGEIQISMPVNRSKLHYYYKYCLTCYKEKSDLECDECDECDEYNLLDPSTYEKLRLDITSNPYILDYGSRFGKIDVMKAYVKECEDRGIRPEYTTAALTDALLNKHFDVADWAVANWADFSHIELILPKNFMDECSAANRIDILDWILKNIRHPKYTSASLDDASANGHIYVLNWWLKSKLPLVYTTKAMDRASQAGHVEVLQWWYDNMKPPSDTWSNFTKSAFRTNKVQSIKWWIAHSDYFFKPPDGYEYLIIRNTPEMISWWDSQYDPHKTRNNVLQGLGTAFVAVGIVCLLSKSGS